MERRKQEKKCSSLSSPKALRGFPHGKSLRAEALGWTGWKDSSLEANQSVPADLLSHMDIFRGDGLNLAKFTYQKWTVNQSPIHVSSSRDESFLQETSLNTSTHPSNSQFEGNCAQNTSKAVFTILLPSTQILIVNSVACKLLGFTAEELCAKRLRDLLPDQQQLSSAGLDVSDSTQLENSSFGPGSVIELFSRDNVRIPVFLFFKKVDTPQRCVAVAELVDRRVATLSVDDNGCIVCFDEEVLTMFQYDPLELRGLQLKQLLPSYVFTEKPENGCEECTTGRTKSGVSFPLCVTSRNLGGGDDVWQVVLWVYSNLSGVLVINQDLIITNCNNLFTSLLFGYAKESVLEQTILKLLPGFCEDGEYGRERTVTADRSDLSNSDPIPEQPNVIFPEDVDKVVESISTENGKTTDDLALASEDYLQVEISNSSQDCIDLMEDLYIDSAGEDDSSMCVIKESDLELQNEMTEKLTSLNEVGFKVWHSEVRLRSSRSDDVLAKTKIPNPQVTSAASHLDLKGTGLQEFPMNRALNVSNLSDLEGEQIARTVREGTFAGRGRHRDGADIDVVYRVRDACGGKGYSVWVARDPWEVAEGGRCMPTNIAIMSSFNSTSMDSSLNKDSEINSRPNSASIISQSDDVLTSGEYSEFYTNLQQIGKGAFGYVKMAYRNEDGLLVITKFIKKRKIHARSWVLDPTLQIKVPLEISLLTTLEHPHIVRVLDVFHNDEFFQLVMEKHGAGMDLFEFIDRKPKLDEKLASYIFRQIVGAIHYLHSLGILHRDIKDENIIINEIFHVKLIDFGSAAFMSSDRLFSTFYGTVEYCSPEVLQGNKYRGPELEIWALGVTLYILTFGENPFYDVEETIKGEFVIPRPISSQLFSLIKGMLDKNVDSRWDIERVVRDPWVNLSVDSGNYCFQKVVRCYHDEAFPAKFISEYTKDELEKDEEEDRTVASSNSFCSLHTIENLEEPCEFQDSFGTNIGINNDVSQRLTSSPLILSSTPRRVCATKSVTPVSQCTEDSQESQARKRYSLDLNTLKKLCNGDTDAETRPRPLPSAPIVSDVESSIQGLEFYDSLEKKHTIDDFENYWDAEDEQYDEDSC